MMSASAEANKAPTRLVTGLVVVLLFAVGGCASSTGDGQRQRKPRGPDDEISWQNLRTKASFDLNCPAEELEIVHISGHCGTSSYNMCMQGVTGCGQRASYMYLTAGSWGLDAVSRPRE
ncbi:hypothetical protein DB30_03278 [Enhygromyxa salina]|uniref:Uncharacterized protein n=1 Tax=Enhygromyxa salina TaxID=215803 RepID=A0A0C2CK08_9BACT|nr:hypothetical protein DB30_03278 [Enhygromyxa salina]